MAKKIFFNALVYNHQFGGWFICEWRDYEYKNKIDKSMWVNEHRHKPEIAAFYKERDDALDVLHEEMRQIANSLELSLFTEAQKEYGFDGKERPAGLFAPDEVIELGEDDGRKLQEALVARGWEKSFIPIGP